MQNASALWMGGLALFALSDPAAAHPHIFIDTGLEVIFDTSGLVTGIRVTWAYDEFYALMIMEERGLDPDGDGRLTEAERAAFAGFDMEWDADYPGDTYAFANDEPLLLSRPSDFTADVIDGRIVSTHLRQLEPPFRPLEAALVVKSYDPTYYFSYTILQDPALTNGQDCSGRLYSADPATARAKAQPILQAFSQGGGPDGDFPRIGELFADEVIVTCLTDQAQAVLEPDPVPQSPAGGSDCWRAWFWLPC